MDVLCVLVKSQGQAIFRSYNECLKTSHIIVLTIWFIFNVHNRNTNAFVTFYLGLKTMTVTHVAIICSCNIHTYTHHISSHLSFFVKAQCFVFIKALFILTTTKTTMANEDAAHPGDRCDPINCGCHPIIYQFIYASTYARLTVKVCV